MKPIGQDVQNEASVPFQPESQIVCCPFNITGLNGGLNDGIDNGNDICGGIGGGIHDINGIDSGLDGSDNY